MHPDLAAALAEINDKIDNLRADMNARYENDITAGEVEALHEDIDKIANAQIDIKARLALLEQERTP
jgi:hypothetical protein